LHILEKELLVAEIVASGINDLLSIIDSHINTGKVVVKSLKSIGLISSLSDTVLVEILQFSNLSKVVLSLELEDLNLLLKVSGLKSEISINIALLSVILVQSEGFEVAVVKQAFLAGQLLLKVHRLLIPIEKVIQIIILTVFVNSRK
jgi:hypothetical protein